VDFEQEGNGVNREGFFFLCFLGYLLFNSCRLKTGAQAGRFMGRTAALQDAFGEAIMRSTFRQVLGLIQSAAGPLPFSTFELAVQSHPFAAVRS